jgi:hypothetical protein
MVTAVACPWLMADFFADTPGMSQSGPLFLRPACEHHGTNHPACRCRVTGSFTARGVPCPTGALVASFPPRPPSPEILVLTIK